MLANRAIREIRIVKTEQITIEQGGNERRKSSGVMRIESAERREALKNCEQKRISARLAVRELALNKQ